MKQSLGEIVIYKGSEGSAGMFDWKVSLCGWMSIKWRGCLEEIGL